MMQITEVADCDVQQIFSSVIIIIITRYHSLDLMISVGEK
jgi:hypothetical protein